mgnify:CR=1 FL=1
MSNSDELLESIRAGLSETTAEAAHLEWAANLPGGDINQAALLTDGKRQWFLKYHSNAPAGMFTAEARALQAISGTGCIRVPAPVAYGTTGDTDWLVLEHLDLHRGGSETLLGEQLAALHRVTAGTHGWDHDNYIGSTPQINTRHAGWVEFWRNCRLQPQLDMAQAAGFRGHLAEAGSRLLENLHLLLAGHDPAPSLLHGDLWSGNKAFTADGRPVIFDPASYYGDRETDIAMTELFGGFGPDFYAAYQSAYPLADGYRLRRDLYKLYHLLNHLNLFGGGYLSRCGRVINDLLAGIR